MKFTLEDVFIYLDHLALKEEADEILDRDGDKISRAVNKTIKPSLLPDPEQLKSIFAAIAKTDDVNTALRSEAARFKKIYKSLPEDDEITDVVIESICHRVLSEEVSGVHRLSNERFEISIEELFQYFDREIHDQSEPRININVYDAISEELDRCRRIYRVLPEHEEIIDEPLFAICRAKSSGFKLNAAIS